MIVIANLPKRECTNTSHCRNETSEYELVLYKISVFVSNLLDRRGKDHQLVKAINKGRIGYKDEAENLFNEANDLTYFMFVLTNFYLENKLSLLYKSCEDTSSNCPEDTTVNILVAKYKLEQLLKCLSCKDYEYKKLKDFIEKDLGIALSVEPNQLNTGIGFMCIIDEDIPDYICNCPNDLVLQVA
jgi:hypothetical protein